MPYNDPQLLIAQLHDDLLVARRAHDQPTSSALQGVIASIDNAGAVSVIETSSTDGVGSTEAPRQELSVQDVQNIIENEIAELQRATLQLGGTENPYAQEMRAKILSLNKYLK